MGWLLRYAVVRKTNPPLQASFACFSSDRDKAVQNVTLGLVSRSYIGRAQLQPACPSLHIRTFIASSKNTVCDTVSFFTLRTFFRV